MIVVVMVEKFKVKYCVLFVYKDFLCEFIEIRM